MRLFSSVLTTCPSVRKYDRIDLCRIALLQMDADPIAQFRLWQKNANTSDNTAAVLATSTVNGTPSARTVLIKSITSKGFTFYSNVNSNKGANLMENPKAAIVFHWDKRQVVAQGSVFLVEKETADKYFELRPRKSKAVTTLSRQSEILEDETLFLDEVEKLSNSKKLLSRPDHWVGFCLKPYTIEFFIAGEHRLNKRFLYTLVEEGRWKMVRLYP